MPPNLCICVCACVHAHTHVRARIELRMGLAKVGRSVGGMVGKVYHILYESSIADRWRGQLANRAWSGRSDGGYECCNWELDDAARLNAGPPVRMARLRVGGAEGAILGRVCWSSWLTGIGGEEKGGEEGRSNAF